MTIECKKDAPAKWVHVSLHEKCNILTVDNKNTLYEFKDGDKLLFDLRLYISLDDVCRVKNFLECNSPKTKFRDDTATQNEQLSLF